MQNLLVTTTVHLALLAYVVGLLAACVGRHHRPWQATARLVWTVGCGLFLVHVAAAFHFHYGWSHAIALRETARQTAELTGVASGAGLYLNYLYTVLWVADAAFWWRGLERYRSRPVAVDGALHGFFLFIGFNATVVFEEGWVRWGAVASLVAVIAVLAVARLRGGRSTEPRRP